MSNVKKPDPVAWRTRYPAEPEMIGNYPWSYTDYDPKRLAFNPEKESLVTTEQAEAYKDACVREALEQAAGICKELQCSPELTPEVKDNWLAIAEKRIRELMQKGI